MSSFSSGPNVAVIMMGMINPALLPLLADVPGLHFVMGAVNIPIEDNTYPTAKQVDDFLTCMRFAIGKVYVHCEQGVGRTGCMVAAYRVIHQQWTPAAALAEAEGFGLRLPCQKNFILNLKASAAHA